MTTPLTAEKIAELERVLAAATAGPWMLDQNVDVVGYADSDVAALVGGNFSNNGPLIVAMHEALPYLLSLAKRVAGAPVVEVEAVDVDGESYVAAFTDGLFTKGTRVALVEIVGGEEG